MMVYGRFLQNGNEFAWRVMISRNLIATGDYLFSYKFYQN
jgi:hypothetical protein